MVSHLRLNEYTLLGYITPNKLKHADSNADKNHNFWEGIRQTYMQPNTYYLPLITDQPRKSSTKPKKLKIC